MGVIRSVPPYRLSHTSRLRVLDEPRAQSMQASRNGRKGGNRRMEYRGRKGRGSDDDDDNDG